MGKLGAGLIPSQGHAQHAWRLLAELDEKVGEHSKHDNTIRKKRVQAAPTGAKGSTRSAPHALYCPVHANRTQRRRVTPNTHCFLKTFSLSAVSQPICFAFWGAFFPCHLFHVIFGVFSTAAEWYEELRLHFFFLLVKQVKILQSRSQSKQRDYSSQSNEKDSDIFHLIKETANPCVLDVY